MARRDRIRRSGDGERCQARLGVVGLERTDGGQALGQRVGDLARVTARPDPRAVDAPASAVRVHALDHQIEILLPVVDLVVSEEDLREAGTVRLHFRAAAVAIDRRRAAEDERALAVIEHRSADVAAAGIDRDGLARNARLEERFRHPVRRPRLLRAGLEHEPDLHRDDRQPERMHARRVRRQHEAEHRALRLEADRHATLFTVARREHVERTARA